jgi:hypothetical protein
MKKFFSLFLAILSISLYAQAFQTVDTHFLGMTEQEFMQQENVSRIETNNEFLTSNVPHFSYSSTYNPRGRKVDFACGYDSNNKINVIAEFIAPSTDNPIEFTTLLMLYSQMYTIIGKESSTIVWFRNGEGAFALGSKNEGIFMLFTTHEFAKKIGLKY